MSQSDYYFGRSTIPLMGQMFYLRLPIAISPTNPTDNLLGSIVREGDKFPFKEYPIPEHSHVPQSALKAMVALGKYSQSDLVREEQLAVGQFSIEINKKIGVNGKAPVPGIAASVGLEIDYKKLKNIEVDFGGSAIKRYLASDAAAECYAEMGKNRDKYPPAFFNKDRMLVHRIIIVKSMSLEITSKVAFNATFMGSLTAAEGVGGGVSFSNVKDTQFTLTLDGTQPYVFGIGAVQADKWVHDD